ncbi:MAG: hypothetical protein ABDH37_05305 [Candidatus Hydrothermales bacterium]
MKIKVFLLVAITMYAHHSKEYIALESYSTCAKNEKIFHLIYDYYVENKDNPDFDHWELTPGFSYGITDHIMFGAHTHFAKFGKAFTLNESELSPLIEAANFAIQIRLKSLGFLNLAFLFSYEIPSDRSRKYLDGKEVIEGKIILSKNFLTHSNISVNFSFAKEGNEFIKEWALGIKNPLSADPHGIAGGIEILGDYNNAFFLLPAIYFPIERSIIKTGIGFGNQKTTYLRANISLMYIF